MKDLIEKQREHRRGRTGTWPASLSLALALAAGACTPIERQPPEVFAGMVRAGNPGFADGIGAAARFNEPYGLAIDGQDNLYIADSGNHVIRRLAFGTGEVTTIAGTPGATGSTDGVGAAARFNLPNGVVYVEREQSLYITDQGNHTLRRLDLLTRQVRTVAGAPGQCRLQDGRGGDARFCEPAGMAVTPDGTMLYVADRGNGAIRPVALQTGEVSHLLGNDGTGPSQGACDVARIDTADDVIMVGSNLLFVANQFNSSVWKIELSGPQGCYASRFATLSRPAGIIASRDEKWLFVANRPGHVVERIDVATGEITTLAGQPGLAGWVDGFGAATRFQSPVRLAIDAAGRLYVSDRGGGVIRRVDPVSGEVRTLAGEGCRCGQADGVGLAARFVSPGGMEHDPVRNLVYVLDGGNSTIRQVDLVTRRVSTLVSMMDAAAAGIISPRDLAYDGRNNVLYEVDNSALIHRIDLGTRAVTTITNDTLMDTCSGANIPTRPGAVTLDPTGERLYISTNGNHTVRYLVLRTGEAGTLAGDCGRAGSVDGIGTAARFNAPWGLAVDETGQFLYVSDAGNKTLRRIELATAEVRTVAGVSSAPGRVDGPFNTARLNGGLLKYGAGGVLYLSDTNNQAIRKFDLNRGMVSTIVVAAPDRPYSPLGLALLSPGTLLFSASSQDALYMVHER